MRRPKRRWLKWRERRMDKLKPCPFCGGTKLKIERKSRLAGWNGLDMRVEMHTYSVRCNTCHARGGAIGGRVMNDPWTRCSQLPDWATTDKTLEAKAAEAWNRRVNDASVVHEKWLLDRWPSWPHRECSRCKIMIPRTKEVADQYWQYCPNCGAKMDGGNEGE